MSIEGNIELVVTAHAEGLQGSVQRLVAEIKAAESRFAEFYREMLLAVERHQIVEEDLPPIIDRHLGDVLAWLREAGHDV